MFIFKNYIIFKKSIKIDFNLKFVGADVEKKIKNIFKLSSLKKLLLKKCEKMFII